VEETTVTREQVGSPFFNKKQLMIRRLLKIDWTLWRKKRRKKQCYEETREVLWMAVVRQRAAGWVDSMHPTPASLSCILLVAAAVAASTQQTASLFLPLASLSSSLLLLLALALALVVDAATQTHTPCLVG
jgi:hypothetical protein